MLRIVKKIFNKRNLLNIGIFVLFLIFPVFTLSADWVMSILIELLGLINSLTNLILSAAAYIFDNLLALSIGSTLFSDGAVLEAWGEVRDLANILFIVGIILISFSYLTNHQIGVKKNMMAHLIILALVINFSFFISRVIIDAGNITALVMYDGISAPISQTPEDRYRFFSDVISGNILVDKGSNCSKTEKNPKSCAKSISGAFVNYSGLNKFSSAAGFSAGEEGVKIETRLFLVLMSSIILSIILAKSLFMAGFMFLNRLIWLVIYTIISPLAFMSWLLPSMGGYLSSGSLSKWFQGFINKSFCITIYLLLLWIVFKILASFNKALASANNNKGFLELLIGFILQVIVTFVLFEIVNRYGSKFCEDGESTFGKIIGGVTSVATSALPVAGGAARIASGALGRGLAGKAAGRLASSNNRAARFLGENALLGSDKLKNVKIAGASYNDKITDEKKRDAKIEEILSKGTGGDKNVFNRRLATGGGIEKFASNREGVKLQEIKEEKTREGFDNLQSSKDLDNKKKDQKTLNTNILGIDGDLKLFSDLREAESEVQTQRNLAGADATIKGTSGYENVQKAENKKTDLEDKMTNLGIEEADLETKKTELEKKKSYIEKEISNLENINTEEKEQTREKIEEEAKVSTIEEADAEDLKDGTILDVPKDNPLSFLRDRAERERLRDLNKEKEKGADFLLDTESRKGGRYLDKFKDRILNSGEAGIEGALKSALNDTTKEIEDLTYISRGESDQTQKILRSISDKLSKSQTEAFENVSNFRENIEDRKAQKTQALSDGKIDKAKDLDKEIKVYENSIDDIWKDSGLDKIVSETINQAKDNLKESFEKAKKDIKNSADKKAKKEKEAKD